MQDYEETMLEDKEEIEEVSEEEIDSELEATEREIETGTTGIEGLNRNTFWNIANSYPRLTKEEEIELARKIKAGDKKAREKLINCNMRLAIQIGVIWYRRVRKVAITVSLEDMIQDALTGMMHAADLYNPDKDIKFSTYAKHFCSQGVRKGLELNGRTIKIPMRVVTCAAAVKKIAVKLQATLGRMPTPEEIYECSEHKFSLRRIRDYVGILRNTLIRSLDMPLSGSEAGGAAGETTKSLSDIESSRKNNKTLEDTLSEESTGEDEVYAEIERREMTRLMHEAIDKVLDERERLVIKALYSMPVKGKILLATGTANDGPTYDATAEMLAQRGFTNATTGKRLTREMIRNIKEGAITKMREYMDIEVPGEENDDSKKKRKKKKGVRK